ncbi:MAG: class beta-lactamase-related serine hydrolase [Phenylobacterium sp.]|nr:class beta-lactamase-related serine hydrolase [Phenylobacterium sp.]
MASRVKTALVGVLAAWIAATAALAQAPPPSAATPDPALGEALRLIDTWLDSAQAYDRVPSLSAAVVQGDKVVWSKGYGTLDAAGKVPTTALTIYSICSISKLFTSIALMQQWEAGRVRLDEPIGAYLPWARLKPVDQDSVPITLRAILSHSAGLPRESEFPYWRQADHPFPTREQLRAKMLTQEPLYPASRWFQYSNLGLTLAGETVEAVSHEPYAAYAQKHVLAPLGLRDTRTFMPMDLYGARLAVGWGGVKRDQTRDLLQPFDARALTPAAGYSSTVEDLGRFAAWQFRLLRTGTPEILKASTLREMQRVQFTDPDWKTTWGLGFSVIRRGDHTYVGHGGDCPGYHSALSLRPDSETAVIAMLTGTEAPSRYVAGAFALMDKRRGWAFRGAPPAKDVDLETYAGRYSDEPWSPEVAIVPWAGGLALIYLPSDDPTARLTILKPKGGDVFRRVRDDGSEAEDYRFERGRDGKVTGFSHFSNSSPRIGGKP